MAAAAILNFHAVLQMLNREPIPTINVSIATYSDSIVAFDCQKNQDGDGRHLDFRKNAVTLKPFGPIPPILIAK